MHLIESWVWYYKLLIQRLHAGNCSLNTEQIKAKVFIQFKRKQKWTSHLNHLLPAVDMTNTSNPFNPETTESVIYPLQLIISHPPAWPTHGLFYFLFFRLLPLKSLYLLHLHTVLFRWIIHTVKKKKFAATFRYSYRSLLLISLMLNSVIILLVINKQTLINKKLCSIMCYRTMEICTNISFPEGNAAHRHYY